MRFIKKLVALTAIAACCITMAGPVISSAAVAVNPGCHDGKHLMGRKVFQGTTTSVTYHQVNEGTCQITTTYNVYLITCECGEVNAGTVKEKESVEHSLCTNP
ncbi:MAG: hypothetical protein ACI4FZ_01320 [Lachnospiraceae bacterium]